MTYECVQLEFAADGVATLTLTRPESLNAWNDAMEHEIQDALRRCDEEDEVRCVVVTGAGRAFCAGADMRAGRDRFRDRPEASPEDAFHPWDVRKPVIAAINGHAIGVGITFALACDVRFVASDAKIAFAFVRRGVLAGFAAHATLARVAGLSNAAELLFSGRTLSGTEAASLGLASQALPAEEVLSAALRLAREIAQHAAPVAVALSKQLLWSELHPGRVKAREDHCFAWAGNQPDAREGVAAFLEKRPPAWTGSPNRSGGIARILASE